MDNPAFGILQCLRCPLGQHRDDNGLLSVPAEAGNVYTIGGIAVLAEAPGAQEAATGRPMVGKAGNLLNSLLARAGLSRAEVVILNRVRCQPVRNRIQSEWGQAALVACDDWTQQELAYYNPSVVVLMGATAMELLFGSKPKVTKTRGMYTTTNESNPYGARTWVATAHPAAIFRDRAWERLIVQDLKLVKELWECSI